MVLMENIKRNKQLKIGFVGLFFFFLFFLEHLLKCNKFNITFFFFPRKNTILPLGAVQACAHPFALFLWLFPKEREGMMEGMKEGRKKRGRKEVKEKEK